MRIQKCPFSFFENVGAGCLLSDRVNQLFDSGQTSVLTTFYYKITHLGIQRKQPQIHITLSGQRDPETKKTRLISV